jgi:hypothetical protein
MKVDEALHGNLVLNANSRNARYVSFMVNFVDVGINTKCHYSWEACAGPWDQLGFLNSYEFLRDPGGDLCTFLDLLIGSFCVMFHTS